MSNRFVSGGTINTKSDDLQETDHKPDESKQETDQTKNPEWEAVQQELNAERRRREESRLQAAQGEGKSLYEILQANKEAKQAAFEEQNKIRNQFRALDDDEIDFLDEVREAQRREEEATRRETEEGLKAFRQRRQVGSAAEVAPEREMEEEEEDEGWAATGRKRKRAKDKGREVRGVRRKSSGAETADQMIKGENKADGNQVQTSPGEAEKGEKKSEVQAAAAKKGLVEYGSDSDDD